MGLSLYAAADAELLNLEQVKAHLRQDIDEEDEIIMGYAKAARAYLEEVCGRSFISATWDFTINDDWPWILDIETGRHMRMIEVPKAPLSSVTSITYVDSSGNTQTLASNQYLVDGAGSIGRIYEAYGVTWPTVRCQPRTITVRFVAGYGAAPASVPSPIIQAALLLTSHFYEQRELVGSGPQLKVPMSVDALIAPFRVYL